MPYFIIFLLSIILICSLIALYFFKQKNSELKKKTEKTLSEFEAIEKASEIAKNKIIKAEVDSASLISKTQEQLKISREKIAEQEKINNEREKKLIERSNNLDKRFDDLELKEKNIEDLKNSLKETKEKIQKELEKVSSLTKEEAKNHLMSQLSEELKDWSAKKIKENENLIKLESDKKSKEILADIISNSAVDFVSETTTTTISIKDDSIISRIIGKSGRNIRTLQNLTGADILIEENPAEVTVSCFDPIRREVASLSLQSLIKTGKISPVTIEETVEKIKKDILKEVKTTGEQMAFEAGFSDLPNELILLLGRFKYRFSYGQNLVKHTLEMVKIAEALALELGANVKKSKLASLLHDIGKVAPEEGKQHHHISAELARKFFKDDEVLANAIEAHHYDIDAKYVESEIVRIADAISGARPGARRDNYEDYIKRIRNLEDIANKQKGVKEAFALQAGREIRVVVKPSEVNDEETKIIAYNIAKEIQATQNYAGIVKVTVIREIREKAEAK